MLKVLWSQVERKKKAKSIPRMGWMSSLSLLTQLGSMQCNALIIMVSELDKESQGGLCSFNSTKVRSISVRGNRGPLTHEAMSFCT